MRFYEYIFLATAFAASVCGCARNVSGDLPQDVIEPQFMNIIPDADGGYSLVSISPFDGSRDTISISQPLGRLIVTSTSYIGFLDAVGADSVIVGVSGGEYVCDSSVTAGLSNGTVVDIGYDANPDYEKIMALKPDLLLTYSVSPVKSQFFSKLESLGIKTFIVNEHLERHPLARAAYIRLFGALTGNMAAADSVLKFIPGQESYLTTLFKDAGGEILGAKSGSSVSGQISVETAYSLSKEADLWMNVGWCQTLEQLLSVNPLFDDFLMDIQGNASARGYSNAEGCATNSSDTSASVVWNDNNRLNPKGGNDFWESGVVHPDLLLRDLIGIFRGEDNRTPIYYKSIK